MTEEVRLPAEIGREMVDYCLARRPDEACGMLARKGSDIVKAFKMTNASASPVRYSLDPREQLAVYNAIDDEGWELGGVWHSHTHTEAYPSPTDVRLASEDVPYLIVSLMTEPADIRAYRIIKPSWDAATGEVVEIPIVAF